MARRLIRLDVEDMVRALTRVPLFAGVPEDVLRAIAEQSHILAFADGQVIVPEGEEGLGFYVILSGAARVVREDAEIAHLGQHEFFGEVALIEGRPRNATVLAEGQTVCLGILRSHFKPLLVRNPRLALRILEEEGKRERSGTTA